MMRVGGVQYAFGRRGDVRSRYADLRASTCRVITNERGELLRRLLGAHERRPPTKEKDEMQIMKAAVMGRHWGGALCGPPAGSSLAGQIGWSEEEGAKRGGEGRQRGRGDRGTGTEGRERRSSLCSLNEVFFLLFCVCVVALGVDDGRVGVGRVVCSFGLVCQVRS